MRAHDIKKTRELFAKSAGGKPIDVTVNGDDIEISLCPLDSTIALTLPYNEDGNLLCITVTNAVLKRWVGEAKEAKKLMSRANAGERNTTYLDMQ